MAKQVPAPGASFAHWTDAIASPATSPAGGCAAALSAALAAAGVEMVAGLTLERPRYASWHEGAAAARDRAAALRIELPALATRDAEAFAGFGRALALPRGNDAERAARDQAKRAALREGAEIQLVLLRHAAELVRLAAEVAEHGVATAVGDAAAGGFLAAGAARSAYWAVRSNLQEMAGDPAVRTRLEEGLGLLERAEELEWRIRQLLNERIR